jgi:hypothetical protein
MSTLSGIPDLVGTLYARIQSTRTEDTLNGTVVFYKDPEVNTVGTKVEKGWREEVMAAYAKHLGDTELTPYTTGPESNGADLTKAMDQWREDLGSSARAYSTDLTHDKKITVMLGRDEKGPEYSYKLSLVLRDMGGPSNGLGRVPNTAVDSDDADGTQPLLIEVTEDPEAGQSGYGSDYDNDHDQNTDNPEPGHDDDESTAICPNNPQPSALSSEPRRGPRRTIGLTRFVRRVLNSDKSSSQ